MRPARRKDSGELSTCRSARSWWYCEEEFVSIETVAAGVRTIDKCERKAGGHCGTGQENIRAGKTSGKEHISSLDQKIWREGGESRPVPSTDFKALG